ncbi:MAG: 4Fe-4S dicluster domain-containing protein [Desulfovibrio sp.]|jgi:electron transport complex protein RnfC|nr:4Fe-4S dicluster domain-containing protein [Desulfovibrio sp.]
MDRRFLLSPAERCPIIVLDDITLVRLPIGDHALLKTVKKRAKVAAGALLARHSSPNVGDFHSPFDGVIKDITGTFIEIEYEAPPPPAQAVAEGAEGAPPAKAPVEDDISAKVEPRSLDGFDAVALGRLLKELGVDIRPFTRPCDLFIINAINPEPGMVYAEELLRSYMPVVEAGFAMLRRLNDAPKFVLALPSGSNARLEGASSHTVRPEYPISLARPLIKAITGREDTSRVTLVRLLAVFQLGLVARSGLPLTHTVATAFGNNVFAPLGTPVSTLLEKAALKPVEGDSVILGGAMRGVAISGLRRGLRKIDDALGLIRKGSKPDLSDNPCINCGACVSVCPMRLRPNMLSRYAEFGLYDFCRKEYIETCIECGMCGHICPSCRPMQQHFRMAKHCLGLHTFQHVLRQ